MTDLLLYDDARARTFEPFALTRPVAELRAGAMLMRERWSRAVALPSSGTLAAAHLADFEELDAPPVRMNGVIPAGTVVANSRFAVALDALRPADRAADALGHDGRIVAVRLTSAVPVERFADGSVDLERFVEPSARVQEVGGWWMDEVWDFIRHLPAQLGDDLGHLARDVGTGAERPRESVVIGDHVVLVEPGATIEPFVIFDASAGPIRVCAGATVFGFTRVVGPCFIGPHSTVTADKIASCSIGEHCRVHGEISTSIVLGHTNKAHSGFVGHSYFGRWVNLGAGTTTSNLKNTYGTVALWTPDGVRDTGLQFLGTFFGDHAKTGIGLRLTTGTVIGAGANVYDAMPPKAVAPFSWGGGAPYGEYDAEKFVAVAARAMSRRHVELGERGRRQLATAHARRWSVTR